MPKSAARPSLATSSSDFALPTPSSSSSSSSNQESEPTSFTHRLRRTSILAPKAVSAQSPLASSFTVAPFPRRRSYHRHSISSADGSESDRMAQDSSPSGSSGDHTPSEMGNVFEEEAAKLQQPRSRPPSTPPRRGSIDNDQPRSSARRLSHPVKQPRIISLLSESRPEETELKSEAAFQRLIASNSNGLPVQPRTPRSIVDRGRYPEEANPDESQREETPSDDEDLDNEKFAFQVPSTDSLPRGDRSATQSVAGDDPPSIQSADSNGSGYSAMDVDMQSGSPSVSSTMTQWRYTPPPTSSAVRTNKRKLEDRFDPYPTAAKRRAVSPSLAHLRGETYPQTTTPTSRPQRLPISIPIPGSSSGINSACSSPTVSSSYSTRAPISISSSPTLRNAMALASPIMRPIPRPRKENEEREVDGAGDAVNALSLSGLVEQQYVQSSSLFLSLPPPSSSS